MKFGLDLPPQQRVYAGFFVYSFCMGSLPPRLPDLQRMMQIKEGLLGFGLIGAAAGTLVSLGFSGPILERIGYRRSILTLIPLLALLYAIASFAGGPLAFFLLLFPVGIVIGESGRFRGVTPLSWPALEGGNPDTSAGRYSPTLRRAPEFVSAGEDVLHAGSIPSVVSSPSVCSRLD